MRSTRTVHKSLPNVGFSSVELQLSMDYFPTPTPAEEIEQQPALCVDCDRQLVGDAYFDDEAEGYFCNECMQHLIEMYRAEANEFAGTHCEIVCPLPEYDAENEHRCTPEEYERGEKLSNTPNSYFAACRHRCTNYEELLEEFERDSVRGRVFYEVIRTKIDDLLKDEILQKQPGAFSGWAIED